MAMSTSVKISRQVRHFEQSSSLRLVQAPRGSVDSAQITSKLALAALRPGERRR